MMRLRWIVIVKVIALFIGLSVALAESELNTKVADRFKVSWSSINYNKTLYNPAVSSSGRDASESLSLSCEIEILDANLVLGTCQELIITQLADSKGRNIDTGREQPDLRHIYYEGLNYRTRYKQPPRPPRWRTVVRSVLRLKQQASSRPERVSELQPSRMRVQLDVGLRKRAGGEISRLEGYFYALMTESFEHIEVPFEPNDNWVRLSPDLEIQVREAQSTESSYRYRIETRRQRGTSTQRLSVGDFLPGRVVVAQQLIGQDGKSRRRYGGLRSVPAHIGGSGSGGGSVGRIEKIRYVIAVNPTHHKIPFELEHIPLPDPLQEK